LLNPLLKLNLENYSTNQLADNFLRKFTKEELMQMENNKDEDYFYYKVNLDYINKTYVASSTSTTLRVGSDVTPIKWYEYVNP